MKKAALAFSLLALAANAQAQFAGPVTPLSSLPLSGNTGGGYSAAPRFSADGHVVHGPAERPLGNPAARIEGDALVIELDGLMA